MTKKKIGLFFGAGAEIGYGSRSIYVFGKGNFEEIIASSLENQKDLILTYLNAFDKGISRVIKQIDGIDKVGVRCFF